jgi:LytS/YehU family sensor histidine kinase
VLAVAYALHRVPRAGARQYGVAALAVAIGAALSVLCVFTWETYRADGFADPDLSLERLAVGFALFWLRYCLMGVLIAGAWLYVRADAEHAAALAQCAVDSARLDEQTAAARLQMLEAQIEPHFLFNTLAHVKRLYDTDAAAGERMLRSLIEYLGVALPQMRESASTLGREVAHATAYLTIQQIRMGRRLTFEIDVPAVLRDAAMPSMMIATLAENAIKHGLSPLPEGGSIAIRARAEDTCLEVQVSDTGRGFVATSGAGTGLANIRARLAALFGDAARLTLANNAPRGIAATLRLPYATAALRHGETA